MLYNQRRDISLLVSSVRAGEKNRKTRDPGKNGETKGHAVRELLGFLRRKAPLAEALRPGRRAEERGGGGRIASTRFPYAKPLYGGRYTKFRGGPHYRASGGAPSSRISGINSALCDIQICAVEFFRSNEIPALSPFPVLPSPRSRYRSRGSFRARSIIENCKLCQISRRHFSFRSVTARIPLPRFIVIIGEARAHARASSIINAHLRSPIITVRLRPPFPSYTKCGRSIAI